MMASKQTRIGALAQACNTAIRLPHMSLANPYIINEREVAADIGCLHAAWSRARTFAFISDRSGCPEGWVEQQLNRLPTEYHEHHFILLTSGSTGRPKLVVGRRDRAERLAEELHQLQESELIDEAICALPLTYCYSFVNQWLWARKHQRKLTITAGLAQPDRFKKAMLEAKSAMLCLVGAQVPILAQYYEGYSFPGIIRVHFAGGRFPQDRLDLVRKLFPQAVIFNNYGCAEAMPRLTLRRAEAAQVANHIGWPLPGIEMKTDESERVLFRSPYGAVALMDEKGLIRVDDSTWVPSGDLGRVMEDGHWELLGREGEVFKRYGEKISLAQILNSVRAKWCGQADCYRETDQRGEAGYVLVLAPHPAEDEVRAILKEISLKHPRTHWPLRLESIETMPLLANGKIDREGLSRQPNPKNHWRQRI
jgi:acyl-CoA synthetase (AMP-forming)/AMP-acid ligase II